MILCFIGPEGSGKGTQAEQLAEKLHLPHVITSDALREVIKQDSPLGKEIQHIMTSGQYVPDEKVIEIYLARVSQPDCENGFIADGFPRSIAQAQALDQFLEQYNKKLDHAILLNISETETIKRLQSRGRYDDTPENIKGRLANYHERADAIIEYYRNNNVLVEINAEQSIELVQQEICAKLGVNA